MKKFSVYLVFLLVFSLLVGCASGGNQPVTNSNTNSSAAPAQSSDVKNEAKVLKIGSVNSDKHTLYEGYMKFKELVEEKTDGLIKVEVYPNGQLGDDRSMIEGLQLGTIEGVGVSTSMLGIWAAPMLAYDLPFAFSNEEVTDQVLDGPFGQKVGQLLEKEGIILLSYMENGFRQLTNSKHEVKSVDDLKGMKIRTMQTPLHLETWKALGANPTPMAYTELFTAMQQGVIDGQENPYGNMALDKFFEVQKYLTVTNHVYNPMGLAVSKKFFDNLTAEQQQILREAGLEASKFQRKLNRDKNEEYKQTLLDGGMIITELTPEARQGFLDKVQSIYEGNSEKIGKEYLEEFLQELEKH